MGPVYYNDGMVVANNNNIDFYLAHTHEIHINTLYNTNKHKIKNKKIKNKTIHGMLFLS